MVIPNTESVSVVRQLDPAHFGERPDTQYMYDSNPWDGGERNYRDNRSTYASRDTEVPLSYLGSHDSRYGDWRDSDLGTEVRRDQITTEKIRDYISVIKELREETLAQSSSDSPSYNRTIAENNVDDYVDVVTDLIQAHLNTVLDIHDHVTSSEDDERSKFAQVVRDYLASERYFLEKYQDKLVFSLQFTNWSRENILSRHEDGSLLNDVTNKWQQLLADRENGVIKNIDTLEKLLLKIRNNIEGLENISRQLKMTDIDDYDHQYGTVDMIESQRKVHRDACWKRYFLLILIIIAIVLIALIAFLIYWFPLNHVGVK